jgi:polyamine oxidase
MCSLCMAASIQPLLVAAGGNARLIKALADEVPVVYRTAASAVHYGGNGVTVVTATGSAVTADACIVTVPLGVLKADAISFHPPLPDVKRKAIESLGCVPLVMHGPCSGR